MNKIPKATLKLMDLKTYFKDGKTSDGKPATYGFALWEEIPPIMIEFAKAHVEAALKAAAKHAKIKRLEIDTYEVDKKSILNAYPLTNII